MGNKKEANEPLSNELERINTENLKHYSQLHLNL